MSRTKVTTGANANHMANQKNPNNQAWQNVGDNKSNQGNLNNPAYWQSRNLPTPTKKK